MEEITEIHTRSLEWGCVCNLIDKISEIEDKMDGHWDALCDMIADVVDKEGQEKNPEVIFFDIYEFFFRLYYRLRANPTKRDFNQLSKTSTAGKTLYRITNYDYNTFKWAKHSGFIDGISNDYMDLPEEKLSTNQVRAFERRLPK